MGTGAAFSAISCEQVVMHVVYVVTSSRRDVYTAMTRLSIVSLRLTNPGAKVTVVVDAESDRAIRGVCDHLLGEADEWLVFETPPGPPVFRNRYIKTQVRNLLDGPFLFLDSDTFVRGDLSPIFASTCDVALATNHSADLYQDQVWGNDADLAARMKWQFNRTCYLNGGLIYYQDNPPARALASEWHRLWLESLPHNIDCRDQAALNSAIHTVNPCVEILSSRFNAQIVKNQWIAPSAVVWHYYSENDLHDMPDLHRLVEVGMSANSLPAEDVAKAAQSRNPWGDSYWRHGRGLDFINAAASNVRNSIQAQGCAEAVLVKLQMIDPRVLQYVVCLAVNRAIQAREYYVIRKLLLHRSIIRAPQIAVSLTVALFRAIRSIPDEN